MSQLAVEPLLSKLGKLQHEGIPKQLRIKLAHNSAGAAVWSSAEAIMATAVEPLQSLLSFFA